MSATKSWVIALVIGIALLGIGTYIELTYGVSTEHGPIQNQNTDTGAVTYDNMNTPTQQAFWFGAGGFLLILMSIVISMIFDVRKVK